MYSLLPENLLSELTLSLLQLMMCRVAAVKHLPVYNHSADHIFGIIGLILGQFENRVPQKP